ncbi:MAG: class I SAM-dependent methyltransferase [Erythrobacter sp.]
MARLLRNGPRAFLSGTGRKLFGASPAQPWISYDAARALERLLDPLHSRVLEFGSGMSTAWYAARAAGVISIEHDPAWYAEVSRQLAGTHHATVRLAPDKENYVAIPEGETFDLIMIDGAWRCDCASAVLTHLAPGGVIYLDNSDKQGGISGDLGKARRILIEFAEREKLPWSEITDIAPTQFFVERGLWVGPNPPA